jgi:hypothetical protein
MTSAMRRGTTTLLLAATLLTACSGTTTGTSTNAAAPSAYDPLFEMSASTAATPDSLTGLWSGAATFGSDDVRLVITSSEVSIALRCQDPNRPTMTVGLTVNAEVTAAGIRVLESKSTGTTPCRIVVRPQSMGRCSTGGSVGLNCFDIYGTQLDFHTGELFTGIGAASVAPNARFEKLNDGT